MASRLELWVHPSDTSRSAPFGPEVQNTGAPSRPCLHICAADYLKEKRPQTFGRVWDSSAGPLGASVQVLDKSKPELRHISAPQG